MTPERRKEIEGRAILTYGAQMQGDMCIEEMSELTKAILKYRRAENKNKNEAEYLNIKPVTLRKWIKQKTDLPAYQIGRLWKFKRSELDAWVNSGKSATK